MLRSAVWQSPYHDATGHHHVMYSFFGASHAELAAIFACSAKWVGILPSSLFIIATDTIVYQILRSIWSNVLLMNSRNYSSFGEFCILKQTVQKFLLENDCEVTVLDGDNVFFRNPVELFRTSSIGCDFVFQQEHGNMKPSILAINIGVFTIVPSDASRQVLTVWQQDMNSQGKTRLDVAVDQRLLQNMFKESNSSFDPHTRRFSLRLPPWVGVHRPIIVGFLSGLDVPHVGHVMAHSSTLLRQSLNWKPYMLHLAWIRGPQGKLQFMAGVGLHFATHDLRCAKNPEGHNWERFFCSGFGVRFLRPSDRALVARLPCKRSHENVTG
jgi:hypothetical protein